jgi:hypothetical protein
MKMERRSKILYPFECKTTHRFRGTTEIVKLYARNRRTAKRLAFGYFLGTTGINAPARSYHMRDKPLAIPVRKG